MKAASNPILPLRPPQLGLDTIFTPSRADAEANPKEQYKSTAQYLEDLQRKMMSEYWTPNFRDSPLLKRHEHEVSYPTLLEAKNHLTRFAHLLIFLPSLLQDFWYGDAALCDRSSTTFQGRENHFELLEQLRRFNPTLHLELHNLSVVVHRGGRKAEVFCTVLENRSKDGMLRTQEHCGVAHWERRPEDGVWVWYRYEATKDLSLGAGTDLRLLDTPLYAAEVGLGHYNPYKLIFPGWTRSRWGFVLYSPPLDTKYRIQLGFQSKLAASTGIEVKSRHRSQSYRSQMHKAHQSTAFPLVLE